VAPTAVSVLLHAGVVNAGAVLLLRLGGVVDTTPLAWAALAAVAGWTMVTSVSALAVTADTKGGLVRSTAAQTGFLLLTVAAALPVAAVAHLVGHAAYKAGAFLGVGGVVSAHHRARAIDAPPTSAARRIGLAALALASTTALLLLSIAVLPGYDPDPILLVFVVATAAAALIGWLTHRPDPAGVATGLVAASVLVPAYVGLLAALGGYLGPALTPSPFDGIGWIALAVAAVAALAPHLARSLARRVPTPTLEDAVFRFSMAAARPPRTAPATLSASSAGGAR
jgi:NADH:ubiquinone oxidoreductase subunit 5 (subunit L)/multisubunit Na+/H+ antiporter MnhA subunit